MTMLAVETSAVVLDTSSVTESSPHAFGSGSMPAARGAVRTAVNSGEQRHNSSLPSDYSIDAANQDGDQPQMKAPHVSTLYEKQDVMAKHFGVTQEQALRTQALLRLGVTDEDVRIAERLMGPRSAGDNVSLTAVQSVS